jgi:hypothetical protein
VAYTRRLGADDGTVLFACSVCGIPARYPTEMRYCADRLFRCNRFCTEAETPLDESRKRGQSAQIRDEQAPRFPVGVAPGWYDS